MNTEILTARDWLRGNPVYLDTETTGLDAHAQIVEVAVVDDHGNKLLNTFVRPSVPIPAAAVAIHGITEAMVATAPTFPELWPELKRVLVGRTVIIYNAQYDLRLLRQSAAVHGIGIANELEGGIDWQCAMLLYADYKGDWDEYHGNNRWHKLELACAQMGVSPLGITAHRAAGDCEWTRRLIHALAAKEAWKVPA